MEPFLDAFGVPAVYTAPDGTKKTVRVILYAAYEPMQYAEGIAVQMEQPTARGSAVDFDDVRDAGDTPTIVINDTTFYIVDVQGSATGDVNLILSEHYHGSQA